MKKPIFFKMHESNRLYIIQEHRFYVAEGRKRLTDQFSDTEQLKKDADAYHDAWLEKKNKSFDPDRDDEGSIYEEAFHEGVQHYFDLEELGNLARLALITGMFHRWEKFLKEYLTSHDSVGCFPDRVNLLKAIWHSKFHQILELFECVNLFQHGCPIRDKLDTCRLVVNTYKHSSGKSEHHLKAKRPELFSPSVKGLKLYDLYVENKNIKEFSSGIEDFWKSIPDSISEAQFQPVPSWFKKAHSKDPW